MGVFAGGLALSAEAYVKAGDLERGEDYFTKALKVNPNDKLAQKGLDELEDMERK
jgi:tetratricopeptide (TPR) repeat protein